MPINLTAEARAVVDGIKDLTGVNKQEAVARLVEWFAQQHSDVQKAILYGHDAANELIRLKMATMTSGGEMPGTIDEAAIAAQLAIDRLKHLAKTYKRESSDEVSMPSSAKKR